MSDGGPLRKQRTPKLVPTGSETLVKVPERELDPEVLMKDPEFVKLYQQARLDAACMSALRQARRSVALTAAPRASADECEAWHSSARAQGPASDVGANEGIWLEVGD
eukprot:3358382-Prymnesium_polylepis.1